MKTPARRRQPGLAPGIARRPRSSSQVQGGGDEKEAKEREAESTEERRAQTRGEEARRFAAPRLEPCARPGQETAPTCKPELSDDILSWRGGAGGQEAEAKGRGAEGEDSGEGAEEEGSEARGQEAVARVRARQAAAEGGRRMGCAEGSPRAPLSS